MPANDLRKLRRDVELRVQVVDGALSLRAGDVGIAVGKARSQRRALAIGNRRIIFRRPTLLGDVEARVAWNPEVVVTADTGI